MLNYFCKTDVGSTTIAFGTGNATTSYTSCNTTGVETTLSSNNTWTIRQNMWIDAGKQGTAANRIMITASLREDAD